MDRVEACGAFDPGSTPGGRTQGGMLEWPNRLVSKTMRVVRLTGVQIPLPPQGEYNLKIMDKNTVLISVAVVYREDKAKERFLLVKESESQNWEMPKVVVRKGESSVRAALRIMGEKGGMTTKVLEEAGRNSGVATTNNKTVSQKFIYYLMVLKAKSNEGPGFPEVLWLEYAQALKKLPSKKEQNILKATKELMKNLKKWKKAKKEKKV